MRSREPRFRLLRFRALDGRAREALRSMLESLPAPPGRESAPAESARSSDEIVGEVGRLVARAGPLDSPLAHFAARLSGSGELEIVLARLTGGDSPPRAGERPLASARRVGPVAFELVVVADSLLRTPNPSSDG